MHTMTPTPYKPIVAEPTMAQCWNSWNLADTGMLLSTVALSSLYGFRLSSKSMTKVLMDRRS